MNSPAYSIKDNDIGNVGAIALAEALKVNTTIRTLSLGCIPLKLFFLVFIYPG
jgi:hypothetical protein